MPSSKFAGLALLISTVGPSALHAADGFAPQAMSAAGDSQHLIFRKPAREAERRLRVTAQRLNQLIEEMKQG